MASTKKINGYYVVGGGSGGADIEFATEDEILALFGSASDFSDDFNNDFGTDE